MKSIKLRYVFIVGLVFFISKLNAQTIDYAQIFNDLTNNIKTEEEYYNIVNDYFKSIDNIKLPIALAQISSKSNIYEIVSLFNIVIERFENSDFVKALSSELEKADNSSNFRIVCIEYLEDNYKKDKNLVEIENLSSITYYIAKDINNPLDLRKYAASRIGKSDNYNLVKKRLLDLLNTDDLSIKNATAVSIRDILLNINNIKENDFWATVLIDDMKNCKNYSLYKSYIITLSYTNSKLARDYLLSILKNSNADEIIPRSLSRFNSSEVIKSIFNVYNEKNENYSYTTEILLKEISLDNITIIDAFKSSNDIDETLIYLKSTRLIEDQVFKKYFINNYKYYLNHETNIVRYEAIKTIHYLFKYEDERKIFSEHLKFETDKEIQELIYGYIGVIQ